MHQFGGGGDQWHGGGEGLQIINAPPMMSSDTGALCFKGFTEDVCRVDCVQNRMFSL